MYLKINDVIYQMNEEINTVYIKEIHNNQFLKLINVIKNVDEEKFMKALLKATINGYKRIDLNTYEVK